MIIILTIIQITIYISTNIICIFIIFIFVIIGYIVNIPFAVSVMTNTSSISPVLTFTYIKKSLSFILPFICFCIVATYGYATERIIKNRA